MEKTLAEHPAETAQKLDDADFFASRGFGQRIGFGERPALLVIDMIRGFTDPEMPLGAYLEPQIDAALRVITVARSRKIPIIFSTVAYDEPNLADAGIWMLKQKGVSTLRSGTPAVEIDPRLKRHANEPVLMKKYASCFFGTDLVPRLVSLRVDTLIICGCTTSGCVRASAVDACQNGFRPMVVREAVGDRSSVAHSQSLFDLDAKYADVVGLLETVNYLTAIVPPER